MDITLGNMVGNPMQVAGLCAIHGEKLPDGTWRYAVVSWRNGQPVVLAEIRGGEMDYWKAGD